MQNLMCRNFYNGEVSIVEDVVKRKDEVVG